MQWQCQGCKTTIHDINDHVWLSAENDGRIRPYHKACEPKVDATTDLIFEPAPLGHGK